MRYAEVAVNSPAAQRRSFSYSIPDELDVKLGHVVRVPFGSRILQGVVVELTDTPAFEQTREISSIVEEEPPIAPHYLSLARWISDYYLSPLFDSIVLMLPPGSERKSATFISTVEGTDDEEISGPLSDEESRLLDRVRDRPRVDLKDLERQFGQKKAHTTVNHLITQGILRKTYEIGEPHVKTKTETFLRLTKAAEDKQLLASLLGKSKKQADVVGLLSSARSPMPWSDVRKTALSSKAVLESLIEKGLVIAEEVNLNRDPLMGRKAKPAVIHNPTEEQRRAVGEIKASLSLGETASNRVFLLHGVTGSGKTEVYLQALEEIIKLGKRGIVLVPEISLTPQTVERFLARFPDKVAIMHSRLSAGEQLDEWRRISEGEFQVVVGTRSAVFAPLPDLGLIVIDEEHEWTYKQQETIPRYHARDVAIRLAHLTGATVILGSATPSVESYFRAQRGDYRLLSLPRRVTPVENAPLPAVTVIDMRQELRAGNSELLSKTLHDSVSDAVAAEEQVILFLNRRGSSTFIQCRKCGFVLRCRRCNVALTYHSFNDMLICHLCNYRVRAPSFCPHCKSPRIKFLGAGTQKLEEEASIAFAGSRVLRWDSDSAKGKDKHEKLMKAFVDHDADILIGTQMITKGLDVPLVTMVGVVNADAGLNLPDFRATERGFQLLSQVAGRAGRGPRGGKVIFQTYNPEHFAVQAAAAHDYSLFYEKEIIYRRQLNYPPFSQLASLIYSSTNEIACRKEAERVRNALDFQIRTSGTAGVSIIGPAPAFVQRLRGRYRWQIVIRGTNLSSFLAQMPLPKGWSVDIDPVGLL